MLTEERLVVEEEPRVKRMRRQLVYESLFLDYLAVVLLNSCACDLRFNIDHWS